MVCIEAGTTCVNTRQISWPLIIKCHCTTQNTSLHILYQLPCGTEPWLCQLQETN